MVALPHVSSRGISVSWERGQEILPGALAAGDRINNEHSGIPSKKLTLLVIDSGLVMSSDSPYSGNMLEEFVNLTSHNASIMGVVGILHPKLLAILQSFQLRIASLIHFSGVPSVPNVIYMTASSSTAINSFLAFMNLSE